jgi:hypothetical protein
MSKRLTFIFIMVAFILATSPACSSRREDVLRGQIAVLMMEKQTLQRDLAVAVQRGVNLEAQLILCREAPERRAEH